MAPRKTFFFFTSLIHSALKAGFSMEAVGRTFYPVVYHFTSRARLFESRLT